LALAQPLPSSTVDRVVRPRALLVMAPGLADSGRLRRCTFRRVAVTATRQSSPPSYEAACLYPSGASAIPLGDLDSARAICDSCAATGIFRPDED
jgi:hypothetical protein